MNRYIKSLVLLGLLALHIWEQHPDFWQRQWARWQIAYQTAYQPQTDATRCEASSHPPQRWRIRVLKKRLKTVHTFIGQIWHRKAD